MISVVTFLMISCGGTSIEKDAKKMAEMYYDYEYKKITKEDFKKAETAIEEKYKEQRDEFMLLFSEKLIEISISKNDWEMAIESIDDYIDEWEYDIDDMPIEKTNLLIKTTQNYISKINSKKEKLTRSELEELEEVEDRLNEIISSNSSIIASASSSNSKNSENWDEVLKSYENYIDQYIKLMKKAMAGDASALSESAKILEKAEDLQEKLEDADDELSASQSAKLIKLQQKLIDAAAEMY